MRSINIILADLKFDLKQFEISLENEVDVCKKENRKVLSSKLNSYKKSFNEIIVDFDIYIELTKKLTLKEWISDFTDLNIRLYNIGIKVLRTDQSEFAIDIFKQIVQIAFEFSNINDDCTTVDTKTKIDKLRGLVKKSFQCLCERLSIIGEYKKALAVVSLYCVMADKADETILRNMLLVVRKNSRNAQSDTYTYSLIQSLEFVTEFVQDECSDFKFDSNRLWKIFDFELKIVSEEWPDVTLLNMICDSYYDFVNNETLDFSTIVWIYLRLFIFHKQIPDKWLQKWNTFPYMSKSNDALTLALGLLVEYEMQLKRFKSSEMSTMNEFLAIFDKQLNESLKILSDLKDKQIDMICYPFMFNNFLKLVITECHLNQFYEYELQASLIYYRINKILNNDLEVWFISSYLVEKLSPRSQLHMEIMATSKKNLKTDGDWLFYSLLFQAKLCKLYFYQQKVNDARDVLKSLKENLKLVPKTATYLNPVSIYVEFLEYLNLMLPCGQHPNFKYFPEIICEKVKLCFKKISTYVSYKIELSMVVDILKGLIFYQKNIEQPDCVIRYYKMLEIYADKFKLYKLNEKIQYEILLLQLKYKKIKDIDISYNNFKNISIIHYDKSDNLDNNLSDAMDKLQLRDTTINAKHLIGDLLEKTSKILEDHSKKNEKTLSNIEIFFHNVHISILYHLLKSCTYNMYFRNLFEIGYELRKQYNKCIRDLNGCKDAYIFFNQQFNENFLPFMFDTASYYSTFLYYSASLEICDNILKMASKNVDVSHIICLKTNLESFFKKKQITDSSKSSLSH